MATRSRPNRGKDELERRKMYNSTHWRRMRETFLAQHKYCIDCGKPANVVDHFMGHNDPEWRDRFWNPAYFAARCAICHNKRTMTVDLKLRMEMKKGSTPKGRPTAMELAIARLTSKISL